MNLKRKKRLILSFGKICEQIRDVRNLDEYIIDWYKKDGIKSMVISIRILEC